MRAGEHRLRPDVAARIDARERHTCPDCRESFQGLVDAENHLVFAHAYARDAARELLAKRASAARPPASGCSSCHRTDGTHAPACARRQRVVPIAKEKPVSKSAERKCRLCRKPGHRANACPAGSNGTGGGGDSKRQSPPSSARSRSGSRP